MSRYVVQSAKTYMKNIVLAQLTKCLEYMLHTVSGYTVSTYNQSSPVYGYSVETVVLCPASSSDVLHITSMACYIKRDGSVYVLALQQAIRNRPALSTTTTL